MTTGNRIESVGWIFFGVVLVLALAPSIYLVLAMTNETLTIGMRVGTGIVVAGFVAGFISWLTNSMLSFRGQRMDGHIAAEAEEPQQPTETVDRGIAKSKKKKKKKKSR